MRPCRHNPPVADCPLCKWCLSLTEEGRLLRTAWDEPEPVQTEAINTPIVKPSIRSNCVFLGEVIDRLGCNCPNRWIRKCKGGHEQCTTRVTKAGIACCATCNDWEEV